MPKLGSSHRLGLGVHVIRMASSVLSALTQVVHNTVVQLATVSLRVSTTALT